MTSAPQLTRSKNPDLVAPSDPVSVKWLSLIVGVAFLLRLAFMFLLTPVISGDGCEYIRMGINLRDGKPLTGSFEWPETMYGTLYPILIAAVSKLGISAEHSAYLLSLIFGSIMVVIAFFLARRVYGTKVGYYAAVLFAIFPVFIGLSGSVFNESVYLTIWLLAIYWSIRSLDSYLTTDFVITGILFGLATLSRPEAFAYPVFIGFAAILVAWLRQIRWSQVVRGVAVMALAWLILLLPYAAFLHRHTGQYRFEGKWNINYTLGNRIDTGMGYFQAGFTINDNLDLVGPLLDSSLYATSTPYSHTAKNKLLYMARAIHRNWTTAYEELFTIDFGGPITILLVVLGLFGAQWDLRRLRHEFILIVMAISIVVLLLTAAHIEHRYAYPLPVIFLIWAAAGLDVFQKWFARTISLWSDFLREASQKLSLIAAVCLIAGLLVFSVVGVRTDWYFMIQRKEFLGIREAGAWLGAQSPQHARMFGFEGRVAYYANATIIIFPYADSATTLRYLESKNIDYIALDSLNARNMPTLGEWFEKGVPDPRAHLVFQSSEGSKDRIKIYRWDKTGSDKITQNLRAPKEISR
jgi:4-amino-4-deoxy-L-arabinose transferase-like glycosyltransferase